MERAISAARKNDLRTRLRRHKRYDSSYSSAVGRTDFSDFNIAILIVPESHTLGCYPLHLGVRYGEILCLP